MVTLIAGDRHLETLGNCGGFYSCPKSPEGKRLGPLVGYAGRYAAADETQKQYVGDIYANFSMAEEFAEVLKFFASCLAQRLYQHCGLESVHTFCGAPIGGYALSVALGLYTGCNMIKAEKKVTSVATALSREKSELVFARHSVKAGSRVIIVEDVCNNFSTTDQLINRILAAGADVEAIVCFLNRSLTVDTEYTFVGNLKFPVISLVRLPINEWKQDDPAVTEDVAKGNVVWKPKDEWPRLMHAMQAHPQE